MFLTADQLVAHAVGDYVLQSDWMANEKAKRSVAAVAHVSTYVLPFLLLTRSVPALVVIVATHFVIDRWRLARYVVWAKNLLGSMGSMGTICVEHGSLCDGDECCCADLHVAGSLSQRLAASWARCKTTGYPPERPVWMSVWLLIIADNIMHVLINGAALRWLA